MFGGHTDDLTKKPVLKWHKLYCCKDMEEKNYTGLIPDQKKGRAITAEAGSKFQNAVQASVFYKEARKRLLFIHNWHKIAGKLSADFQLTNEEGNEVDRFGQKGDHFRIDITGPGSKAGDGFDWAKVEDIKEVNTIE
jgi:hypothetical protein